MYKFYDKIRESISYMQWELIIELINSLRYGINEKQLNYAFGEASILVER